ncbi:MAG: glycoside hydrolase family 2 [Tenericutes bacterium]|nr:glycoside hydrolase family 2 [Mycoplasmatota bacterium]
MKHTKCYISNYPRPLMTRPNWINLNGEWDFVFDDNNQGLNSKWNESFPLNASKILVPYSYHTAKSKIFDTTYHPYMWYRKLLEITKKENETILLHFEAVDYASTIYINGLFVGKHIGGYNRFSFDISEFLVEGQNTITVFVHDDFSKEKPRGKQRYKKENFECWYIETSGIWKTAWIERVNNTYITDLSFNYGLENVKYNINTENMLDTDKLSFSIYNDETCIYSMFSLNNKDIEFPIPHNIEKWSEFNPKLYDIKISIIRDSIILDTIQSYIGFRFITYKEKILINDKLPYFKMILDQGYFSENHLTATEDEIKKDLLLTKKMGFNGIRKHEKLESQVYNYYCDILGIYTWQEMPSFYEFSELSKKRYLSEYKEMIHQYINHPSIIAWVPFNESWGITDIYNDKDQQAFTLEVYKLTKKLDPTRPVVTNDGWEHTVTDIVTFHNYQEYGEGLLSTYGDIEKILTNETVMPHPAKKAFAKGFHYMKQPLMMTEFAGIAFNDSKGWGYGETVKTKKEFINRLSSLINAIKKMDYFQGYCITQLTDVQQEINGLLFESREAKINLETIKELNQI